MNKSRKVVITTKGEQLFDEHLSIFVNRIKESFVLSEHDHDFVEITYVSEGTGIHYIDNQTINVKKGDLFYIPLGVSHIFRPSNTSEKDSLIVYNCIFRESLFDFLQNGAFPQVGALKLTRLNPAINRWMHFKEHTHEFRDLFTALLWEHDLKPLGHEAMLFALFIQLLLLLERREEGSNASSDSGARRLDVALEYMRDHLHESLTLPIVSKLMNIGERQLQRLIKKATGQTFIQWLQGERISKSCELLLKTTDKIPEIAQQVGFQDLKHFHRLFKSKTGVTPNAVRLRKLEME
ncbi:AraC family transcriptional regulator [Paenibacillus psychroresistens]|uniref:AraC family transcriptional regulator n=1 Tax=Paenibacillus psychroresistens TaxID=1778678 RepID=A0A6B8RFR4_9BACL|nr:helix-turn-helix domain-containing protein [Paenibacillus psychroresistens]QGQ94342.1 AraC family transcriptional regulator [Paenibacillus psychroresistens]